MSAACAGAASRKHAPTSQPLGIRMRSPVPALAPVPSLARAPFRLFGVADAVDRTGPVIGHQQRPVLGDQDVGGPTGILLVAGQPALREGLLPGVLAIGLHDHALDAGALVFVAET